MTTTKTTKTSNASRQPLRLSEIASSLPTSPISSQAETPSPAILRCRAAYSNAENFLRVFNPDNQAAYTRDIKRVYLGHAPSLNIVAKAFSRAAAEAWLAIQLRDLSEFTGAKGQLTADKLDALAKVIIAEYGFLKVTELMHFFLRFKAGYYGRFYGSVDALVITEALNTFCGERRETIAQLREHEEAAKRNDEWQESRAKAVTYEEYLRWRYGR